MSKNILWYFLILIAVFAIAIILVHAFEGTSGGDISKTPVITPTPQASDADITSDKTPAITREEAKAIAFAAFPEIFGAGICEISEERSQVIT